MSNNGKFTRKQVETSLQVALDALATHPNWHLFPIKRHGKKPPLIEDNLNRASNDPEQIKKWHAKWPGCGWGLALAKSHQIVFDIDRKEGAGGERTYRALRENHKTETAPAFPMTFVVQTPSGGWHAYFNETETVKHVFALGKSGFGEGLDSPNYVLIAGCQIKGADGELHGYTVKIDKPIAAAPDWFSQYLKKRDETTETEQTPVADMDTDVNTAWAIDFLTNHASPAIEANNDGEFTTLTVAATLKDHGMSESKAVELMFEHYNPRCEPAWEFNELATKVANAYAYCTKNSPGESTPEHDFGGDNAWTAEDDASMENLKKATEKRIVGDPVQAAMRSMKNRTIKITYDEIMMPVMIELSQNALIADKRNDPIFRRGPSLCRLNQKVADNGSNGSDTDAVTRKAGSLMIRETEYNYMMTRLQQAAIFLERVKNKEKAKLVAKAEKAKDDAAKANLLEEASGMRDHIDMEISVPRQLVMQLLAMETLWRMPWLEGVVEAPTMRLDGTLLTKGGYDEKTGVWYDDRHIPNIPAFIDNPTRDDALRALDVLKDILDEFPFEDDVSRSVALAAIITAMLRRVLSFSPGFLFDAPGQSNGKTLLADVVAMIPTGREAGVAQWSGDSEEQRKSLGSIIMAGDSVVNFDNCTVPIGGGAICSVITAKGTFQDRILGGHDRMSVPVCTTFIFGGNNITVKDDMGTRVVRCRLDAKCEFPDLRQFKRKDLLTYVKENRGKLIHAVLTIVRAHVVAGKPCVDQIKGRFGQWNEYVAAPLVWLDMPDPTASRQNVIADDTVRQARIAVMEAWRDRFGIDKWVTAKEIGKEDEEWRGNYRSRPNPVMQALDEIEGGGKSRGAVARKLKSFEGVIVNGCRFLRRDGDGHHTHTAWMLCRADGEPDVEAPPMADASVTAAMAAETVEDDGYDPADFEP
jgi:bifunctional DNA primase/polymerase-like protein